MFGLSYSLYKALSLIVMPMGISFVALVLAVVLLYYRRRKATLVVLVALAAWLWLWSTPLWSNFLRGRLESQYTWKPAWQYPVADAIVALGGGIRGDAGTGLPPLDLNSAADREVFAAQLYHAGRSKVVIVSAGVDPLTGTGVAGKAMKHFLEMLGVPAAAIRVEGRSRNTVENASEVKGFIQAINQKSNATHGDKPTQKTGVVTKTPSILLVTSALHMPRACWLFARTGLRIIPAPADFEVIKPPFSVHQILPDASALETSTRAAKEIVGLWAAKLHCIN
jgi:uncharacterized SAM-binding protein YcdF (DUF218 family)